jgi:RNA polymerase sigma-70 factor (ECF subfamily)
MIGAALMVWEGWVTSSEVSGEIQAIRRGDRDAFAFLLARYQNRLYRYLIRMVCERATAEDLFQQTWLKVLENIHRYDPKRNFEAWLFTVARNVAIDYLRRSRLLSVDEPSEDGPSVFERFPADDPGALENVIGSERAMHVRQALEAQPPMYREILSLRFEEEMKLEEIAEVLGIPLSTVKSRLGRALERLRTAVLRLRPGELTP